MVSVAGKNACDLFRIVERIFEAGRRADATGGAAATARSLPDPLATRQKVLGVQCRFTNAFSWNHLSSDDRAGVDVEHDGGC